MAAKLSSNLKSNQFEHFCLLLWRYIIDFKNPWLSQGLSKSIRRKNKLYKKFMKPTLENENLYKKYKNKLIASN